LKTAGIVAFFRIVDYSNEEMIAEIELAFGIPKNVFWQAVCRLHGLELLDMYENEIVRTSDQVLATYLFYLAFFVKRVLNFSALLESFFPRLQYRLVDALNPVLNTFDSQKVIEIMRPQVDQAWIAYKNAGDETSLMHLMEVFWFLKETDILIYVHDCISKMEAEVVDLSTLEIKPNSQLSSPSILTTLGLFVHSSQSNFRMALDLLFRYLAKLPKELPRVLYLLTDRFGFEHDSYADEFVVQRAVIDVLWEQTQEGRNELFSKLFLAVAEQYLQTHFSTSGMKGRRTLNILNFDLPPTEELFQLRRKIWQGIFQLYQMPIFKDAVLTLLHKYGTSGYKVNVSEIIKQDAVEVIPFIESAIESSSYSCCLVVQDYLNHLEKCQVAFDEKLRGRFTNQIYTLSKVLLFDRIERRNIHLNYEEYEQLKRQQIVEYFASYNFSDYEKFFNQCLEIQTETNRRNHNAFHFPSRIVEVLIALAHRDSDLYIEVMKHYLSLGNPFQINDLRLVNKLIEICGVEETYRVLHEHDCPSKRRWLFDFYRLLPQEKITVEYLEQLYSLYRESTSNEVPHDLDFLLRYYSLDENVVVRVTEIILERSTDKNSSFLHILSLFNEFTGINKNLSDLFKDHFDLLKQAYLAVLKVDFHTDHDMKSFANILDADSNFILEYIDWIYKQKEESYRFDVGQNYSFIWKRDDYEELMNRAIAYTYKREKEQSFSFYSCIEKFFILKADDKDNEFLWKRQDHLLSQLIEHQHQDVEFMQFIFNIVMTFSYTRRHQLTAVFLNHNKNFEAFEKIPLEPSSWSWTGSAVPMYQRRIEYLESLLPLLNTVDFLQHRQYVEQYIQSYRGVVEREKKKDFMED